MVGIAIVVCIVFGVCFLLDKGFTKVFRGQVQHKSGLAVKVSKRYASFGILLVVATMSSTVILL